MPSMSQATLPALNQGLKALDKMLEKLAAHCQSRSIDANAFLGARLFPDMFPMTRQIQIACDFAKGAAARLSGRENPSWEDKEASIEEVRARIAKTLDFINAIPASEIDGSEQKTITIKVRGTEMSFPGETYLAHVVLPNFYFHLTTAYALMRHNGLDVGKNDFLGRN